MTKFTVPATTLQRFITLYKSLEPIASEAFKVLKLEISNSRMYLIGSNEYVACVEHLGETEQPDDSCYVKINSTFIDSVEKEANVAATYTFETLPELAMGSTSTSDGQTFNDFIVWPDESPLDKWRDWFVIADKKEGFMYCNLGQLVTLWECSPSGYVTFPKVINAVEPVIVRDVNNADWLGAFIPAVDGKAVIKPATLPEWL